MDETQDTGGNVIVVVVGDVWDWLNEPFRSPVSVSDLFLIVGAVILSIMVWSFILYHIRIAGEVIE